MTDDLPPVTSSIMDKALGFSCAVILLGAVIYAGLEGYKIFEETFVKQGKKGQGR